MDPVSAFLIGVGVDPFTVVLAFTAAVVLAGIGLIVWEGRKA